MKAGNIFLLKVYQILHIVRTQHIPTEGSRGGGEGKEEKEREFLELDRFKQKM